MHKIYTMLGLLICVYRLQKINFIYSCIDYSKDTFEWIYVIKQLDPPLLRPVPAGSRRKVLTYYWRLALAPFFFMAWRFV